MKFALALTIIGLAGCGMEKTDSSSAVKRVSKDLSAYLTIYDETAEGFVAVFNVLPDSNGDRAFTTSDGSLEISCAQGLRPSCTFGGEVRDASITIYDEPAEQFAGVLNIAPDINGDRAFETVDKKLAIRCSQGLRYSCTVLVK